MKKAAVCVPVYKPFLNTFEEVALRQINAVLGGYDRYLVLPASLSYHYGGLCDQFKEIRIDDSFFESKESYSQLLLSVDFYRSFGDYEYILICQTDALVFNDKLSMFCDMGYDYIGAPSRGGMYDEMGMYVGNGGLSLRKVDSVTRILHEQEDVLKHSTMGDAFRSAEDVFFTYCGGREDIKFDVPDIMIAQSFAAEHNFNECLLKLCINNLPFGTHYWPQFNYQVWYHIVREMGYSVPAPSAVKYIDSTLDDREWWKDYCCRTYAIKANVHDKRLLLKDSGIEQEEACAIWGGGVIGVQCIELLTALGIQIEKIIDKKSKRKLFRYSDIPVIKPDIDSFKSSRIVVISSTKYESEMCNELDTMGFVRGTSYFVYSDLLTCVRQNYIRLLNDGKIVDGRMDALLSIGCNE
ncbi:MAG: hypothetical protein IJQ12_01450 [Lachnospiraceae bacterium]|nr:hypothetical protein [Lachnospiraceae bacterium]